MPSLKFSAKIQPPKIRPREEMTLKGLMHEKVMMHIKSGALKMPKFKFKKQPALKIPHLKD